LRRCGHSFFLFPFFALPPYHPVVTFFPRLWSSLFMDIAAPFFFFRPWARESTLSRFLSSPPFKSRATLFFFFLSISSADQLARLLEFFLGRPREQVLSGWQSVSPSSQFFPGSVCSLATIRTSLLFWRRSDFPLFAHIFSARGSLLPFRSRLEEDGFYPRDSKCFLIFLFRLSDRLFLSSPRHRASRRHQIKYLPPSFGSMSRSRSVSFPRCGRSPLICLGRGGVFSPHGLQGSVVTVCFSVLGMARVFPSFFPPP